MKHPAAQDALRYIKSRPENVINGFGDSFITENDQISIRCYNTMQKILSNKEVEDIDILGLAYVMKQGECG